MNELNFNVFNILIIAGVIHGFIFSLIITLNKNLKSNTNIFLALTIISLSLSNLQYWLIDTNIIPRHFYEQNIIIYIPFEFLILPFFLFFVRSFIKQKIKRKYIIYILSPFIFSIIYILTRNLLSNEIQIVKLLNLIVEYISIIFSALIIISTLSILRKHEIENKNQESSKVIIKTKWLKNSLILGIILCALWALSFNIFENLLNKGYYKYYPLWIGMSILVYWIGYTAILQKHLYSERLEIKSIKDDYNKSSIQKIISTPPISSFNKINALIKDNNLHLNPDLKLKSLAIETNLSEGYISQLINEHSNLNFNDYINSLRIYEAKYMLSNKDFNNYTILAIGLESGFNSKSSFYTAFKKFVKKTPVEYKKSVQNL